MFFVLDRFFVRFEFARFFVVLFFVLVLGGGLDFDMFAERSDV